MENENRLIDANRYLRETKFQHGIYPHQEIFAEINEQPTVDAVEVVRCKDCKNNGACSIQDAMNCGMTTVNGENFCSYGERREGE